MRNSRMNRYTIANTSEFQRCLHSIHFDAHSTNNCHRCRSESFQKIAKFLGPSAWLDLCLFVNVILPRNVMSLTLTGRK